MTPRGTAGKDCAIWAYCKLCSADRGCLLESLGQAAVYGAAKTKKKVYEVFFEGLIRKIGGARKHDRLSEADIWQLSVYGL